MTLTRENIYIEINEMALNAQKNAKYLRSRFNGTDAQFLVALKRGITDNIHKQNLHVLLNTENDITWRKQIWVALCRYAGITMKELLFDDLIFNDKALGRTR